MDLFDELSLTLRYCVANKDIQISGSDGGPNTDALERVVALVIERTNAKLVKITNRVHGENRILETERNLCNIALRSGPITC